MPINYPRTGEITCFKNYTNKRKHSQKCSQYLKTLFAFTLGNCMLLFGEQEFYR